MSQTQPQPRAPKNGQTDGAVSIDPSLIGGYRRADYDTNYLKQVVKTEAGQKYVELMEAEFSPENLLANRTEAELWEAYWQIHTRTDHFLQEHPPEGSKMTGSFRALVYGNDNEPLSDREVRDVLAVEGLLKARITNSRNFEQQKLIKEMRQEQTLNRQNSATGRLEQIKQKLSGGR